MPALATPSHLAFARFETKADQAQTSPGFYPGVLVIETGVAKGHFAVNSGGRVINYDPADPEHAELEKYQIVIGDATLDDVVRCGNEAKTSKCKLDHGATVRDIVGQYSNFRRDGNQVRADLTLMRSTPHKEYVEELFSDFCEKVGNSIDFDYLYEIKGTTAVARCRKLNSVDLVDAPAATNSLFQQQTQPDQDMPLTPEDLKAITGVINTAVDAKFTALQGNINTRFEAIDKKLAEGDEGEGDEGDEADKPEGEKAHVEPDGDEAKKVDDDVKLAAMIKTATLSAVREILPKAVVANLASLNAKPAAKDEWAEKIALCEAAGITKPAAQMAHIARKFPAVYNAKFGNGAGGKGSATTTTL